MPNTSLNSLGGCNLAGRWWCGFWVSTHASHTKSWVARMMCSAAPWAFKCADKTIGSGCPRFLCNFTNCCFSSLVSARKHGPCNGVGGGAHPSQTVFGSGTFAKESTAGTRELISLGIMEFSTCGGTGSSGFASPLRLPKMVSVNRLGMVLATLWARVSICQFRIPRSCKVPSARWIHSVWHQGDSWDGGAEMGTWKRSVPLQMNTQLTLKSSFTRCCTSSPRSLSASYLWLPTRGASRFAIRHASCQRESPDTTVPSTGPLGWSTVDTAGAEEFTLRFLNLSGSARGLFMGGSSSWTKLFWHTFECSSHKSLAHVSANPWQYVAQKLDTGMVLPSWCMEPAIWVWSWLPGQSWWASLRNITSDVVQIWLRFRMNLDVLGSFNPKAHMSKHTRLVCCSIGLNSSVDIMDDPTGCSRWKCLCLLVW